MSKILKEKVRAIKAITSTIYRMTIESPYVCENAKPGQFVNIKCCDGINALLRRPISICDVDKDNETFDIVFQVKGIGTELLSQKQVGDEVDLIGPLGNPFYFSESYKKVAVVGGGIGVFPLYYLLKEKYLGSASFIGFRNRENVVFYDEFKKVSDRFFISTDDGSVGYKGLITDLLKGDIIKNSYDIIYACGPTPMIKNVINIARENNIKCQVSLEQRMGCGIGACLVCACKLSRGNDWEYGHVCKDGPVFWSDEVILDD